MNKLAVLFLALSLASCMSVRKARKVFNDNPLEAARYAAEKYPRNDSTIIIIKEPDSFLIKQAIDSAVSIQDSICQDYANAVNLLLQEKHNQETEPAQVKKPKKDEGVEQRIAKLRQEYKQKIREEAEKVAKAIPPKVTDTKVYQESPRTELYRLEWEASKSLLLAETKKLKEQTAKKIKWVKISMLCTLIIVLLLCYTFRKPLGSVIKRLILGLFGLPKIPPL